MTELPENFVFHIDCLLPWQEFLSAEEVTEVGRYAHDHFDQLAEVIAARNPHLSIDDIEIYEAEEDAFHLLFPAASMAHTAAQHKLALEAYAKRGAGDGCAECAHEEIPETWTDASSSPTEIE